MVDDPDPGSLSIKHLVVVEPLKHQCAVSVIGQKAVNGITIAENRCGASGKCGNCIPIDIMIARDKE